MCLEREYWSENGKQISNNHHLISRLVILTLNLAPISALCWALGRESRGKRSGSAALTVAQHSPELEPEQEEQKDLHVHHHLLHHQSASLQCISKLNVPI